MVTSFSVVSFSRIGVHCNRECCDRTALDGHFSLLLLGGAGERPAVTLLPGLFGGVDAFCFSILPLLLLELLSRSESESDSFESELISERPLRWWPRHCLVVDWELP